jgi:hypothetical protein
MDFLFIKSRTPWVFLDREATKIGALFERDMARGQALTMFDTGILMETARVETVDGTATKEEASVPKFQA